VFGTLPPGLGGYYSDLWRRHGESTEGEIVSVADKLAGLAFAQEQLRMGNQFMAPVYRRFVTIISTIPYEWWPLVQDRVCGGLIAEDAEAPDPPPTGSQSSTQEKRSLPLDAGGLGWG
jgi:hypothetical protein